VNQPQRAIEDAGQVIAQNPSYYFPRRSRAIKLLAYEQLGDAEAKTGRSKNKAMQLETELHSNKRRHQGLLSDEDEAGVCTGGVGRKVCMGWVL